MRSLLHFSPPPSKHRRMLAKESGQYLLPYVDGATNSTVEEAGDHLERPRSKRPRRRTSKFEESGSQEFGAGTHTRKSEGRKNSGRVEIPMHSKLLVSREEAAAMLSISVRALDYLVANDRLSSRRIGSRVLIPIEDVRRFAGTDHPERMAG